MRLKNIWNITSNISILAYLIVQSSSVFAGSVMLCTGDNTADGTTTTDYFPSQYCVVNGGAGLFELNYEGFSGVAAGIGLGISPNGPKTGTVYVTGQETIIDTVTSLNNHQITNLANGILDSDAVNLGQVKASAADTLAQSQSYTDLAKADAISQSNAYTDLAKADAIAQSNTYTDQEINNLSNHVVHYDSNEDGTPNKNSVTFEGANGTKLTNIANGQVQSGSKDAVNGDQLNTTNQTLVQYVGGGAVYDSATQTFGAPTFTVGNVDYHNVADSVSALDNRIDSVNERVDVLTDRVGKLEDNVQQGLAMSAALTGLDRKSVV